MVALLALAGCASPVVSGPVHVACTTPRQKGCIQIDVLNARWDGSNPIMVGLDQPYHDDVERRRRVKSIGPDVWEGYKAGTVQAAGSRIFLVYMWNMDTSVSASHMAAYRRNGSSPQGLVKVPVENTWRYSVPQFDPVSNLGRPTTVFRVHADGKDSIGVAFQFPWSAVTEKTYILVCTEDRASVYPNRITADEGLWITPEYLNAAKERGWVYIIIPFLSKR